VNFLLWVIVGALTIGVVFMLLRPLLSQRGAGQRRDEFDMQVYRDQLRELDSDFERGLITPEQQAAARTEIERRMLAVADQSERSSPPPSPAWRYAGIALVLLVVPAGGLWIYQNLGSPHLPDQPLAQRDDTGNDMAAEGGGELDTAVARLAERLKENPEDRDGWMLLGRSYAVLGRYQEAVAAYREALALDSDDPDAASALGEMIVMTAGGQVTPAARRTFEDVLAVAPDDPSARYYLGLADLQAGRPREAMDRWQALAADSPPDAPWLAEVRARINDAAERLGVEPPEIAAPEVETADRPESDAAPGPTADDMAAARDMAPEDRMEMIRGMVGRLAARLEEQPDDFAGWMRLANSYRVLGQTADSRDAYGRAVDLQPENLEALSGLARAQVELADPAGGLPEAAVETYRRILAIAPEQPDALWFVAEAEVQAGNEAEAVELLKRLLPQLPPESDAYKTVAARIEELDAPAQSGAVDEPAAPEAEKTVSEASATDEEAGTTTAAPGAPDSDQATDAESPSPLLTRVNRPPPPMPGPSDADIAAASRMTPEERKEMIRGMVERLAERLERAPSDTAGWLRLARSYGVLGEPEKAIGAYERALEQDTGNPHALAGLTEVLVERPERAGSLPEDRLAAYRRALEAGESSPRALWLVGMAEAEAGRPAAAASLWQELLAMLPPESDAHAVVAGKIEALETKTP